MPEAGAGWELGGFLERFDAWAEREGDAVDADLRIVVMAWLITRGDDPYQGVQRVPDFPNFWFGVVPDSHDGQGNVVGCSYWIIESDRLVRCDNYGLLSWPV